MNITELKQQDSAYIAATYPRANLDVLKGSGAVCRDASGKEFLDFSSGIGVNTLGFADSGWVAAVEKQLHTLNHISNLYYTHPQVELAQTLCQKAGMQRVFFANSGAEANEGLLKAARKYSSDKYGEGRYEIISLVNSFHGRTIGTLSATGQEVFHQHFGPFLPGFVYAKANDLQDLASKVSDKTCAILIECIQGEGGVVPLEADFMQGVQQICNEKDILLTIDEVQTGIGRTGAFFCYQHYGLTPDIVSAAKGLGGGLPMGAVLFGEKTKDTLGKGSHGTTFGGNPIVAAGAGYIMSRLTPEFLQEVTEKGTYLTQKLLALPGITGVTGKGLMLGAELVDGLTSPEITAKCAEQGLILLTAKHKLRFLPPLSITYEELNNGLAILAHVLNDATK